jgi:hypothetical protein
MKCANVNIPKKKYKLLMQDEIGGYSRGKIQFLE